MTSTDHAQAALRHADRVTSVGERDIIPALVHAILAVAAAIREATEGER